jgi:uncharacterized RDD family membrane protein YckC
MQDLLNDIYVEPVLAKKRMRWFASAIDHIIVFTVWCILVFSFGEQYTKTDGYSSYHLEGYPVFLITVLPWLLIIPGIEALNDGQTIGKALLGVRVVKVNGSRIGFSNAIGRHIIDFVDYFPFFGLVGIIVAANSQKRQRVGDLVGKTIVIDARQHRITES